MLRVQKKFNILKDRQFFFFATVSIVLAVSFWILFLEKFKVYQTEISILFIPKSELLAMQSKQVLENLAVLPRQLSFYEKVLADGKFTDSFNDRTLDERKKMWNEILHIKQAKSGSIITIGIDSKKREDSLAVSNQTAKTLLIAASRYYDAKKDLDMRIIDKPIVAPRIKNLFLTIILSLFFGAAAGYLIYAAQKKFSVFALKIKDVFIQKNAFSFGKESDKKLSASEKKFLLAKKPEVISKKNIAPSNLPIATGEYPFSIKSEVENESAIETKKGDEEISVVEQSESSAKSEPTDEELKKRLNQLLKGEL